MTDSFELPIYLSVDDQTRHWLYLAGKKPSAAIHKSDMNGSYSEKVTRIHNGRDNKDLTLDEVSFELVDCPTLLSREDFYAIQGGNGELIQKYHGEVKSFVKKRLGCDKVVCFNHQVRNEEKSGKEGGAGVEGYAGSSPHTDSSPVDADQLALSLIDDPENYERYLYLNLWRNIAHEPIENDHLAMVDERTTIKPDDYIVKDLYGKGFSAVQYGLNARHANNHMWYHFPDMTRDEAIIFKQMDSDWTKRSRICFHMSAHNSEVKSHKSRESIELRIMCFWKVADSGVNSMPTIENTNLDMIKDPEDVAKEMSIGMSLNPFNLVKGMFQHWRFASAKGYSGNPEDYQKRFIGSVNSFSFWPADAKNWVKMTLSSSESLEAGISAITKSLVDDKENYAKTKSFKAIEKKAIVAFLMTNEEYLKTAEEKFVSSN